MIPFNILSFNETKIEIVYLEKGTPVVRKRTTKKEYFQIMSAHEHLIKHPAITESDMISILPAPVVEWCGCENVLVTEYCHGKNIEQILCTCDRHTKKKWIKIFKEIYAQFKLNGFLWGDFAPRNMIFNEKLKTIRIVDFERKLILYNDGVDSDFFSRYVRNYSLEEFSCFLFEHEQEILFSGLTLIEKPKVISTEEIQSKRKKELLSALFGAKNCYTVEEILEAEKLMVNVATPFLIDNKVVYPMDIIDNITSQTGPKTYVKIIKTLSCINDSRRKYVELIRIKKAFR